MNFIPLAGPWIALGQSGCAADEESTLGQGDCEGIMALRGVLYVVDALVQLGGVGILAEGIFMTTQEPAPAAGPRTEPAKETSFRIMPLPIVTHEMTGLGVVGQF
jgi:hypothetical protein